MSSFKDIWSENGDSISFQYAGTASCITSVTKNGKHGFLGFFQHGLVSIKRFYQGNFDDGFKQKCIDTLLQKNAKKKQEDNFYDNPFRHSVFANDTKNINKELFQNPNFFISNNDEFRNGVIDNTYDINNDNTKYLKNKQVNNISKNKFPGKDLKLFIGTWNLGGQDFPEDFSLIPWLYPRENQEDIPDMYVIGFQEIINLSAKNIIISSNSDKVNLLKSIVSKNLSKIGKFTIVKILDLVGILSMVFIKENLCEYVKNIETSIVKTGLMGALGNKGNCIIRFNFQGVSFAFSCCHLKAGIKEVAGRTQELSDILNYNIQLKDSKEILFKKHDVFFIFGDLNFRIDLDISNCMDFIKTGYLDTLFLYDQLNKKKSISKDLVELDEMNIKFPPTYKYEIGSNDYDFRDKRIPSWCDRITFNYNPNIKGLYYDHIDSFQESDHKPIFGIFNIVINEERDIPLNNKILNKSNENFNNNNNFNGNFNNNVNNFKGNFYDNNNPSNNPNNASNQNFPQYAMFNQTNNQHAGNFNQVYNNIQQQNQLFNYAEDNKNYQNINLYKPDYNNQVNFQNFNMMSTNTNPYSYNNNFANQGNTNFNQDNNLNNFNNNYNETSNPKDFYDYLSENNYKQINTNLNNMNINNKNENSAINNVIPNRNINFK